MDVSLPPSGWKYLMCRRCAGMLAEVSEIAVAGAKTLNRFLNQAMWAPLAAHIKDKLKDVQLAWTKEHVLQWPTLELDFGSPKWTYSHLQRWTMHISSGDLALNTEFPYDA
ncbi:hypothetical protein BBP40_002325 [Aspergillus hancockii]|nr:hypothetical protein BBP40_002325 [Aspergillus hancockii]